MIFGCGKIIASFYAIRKLWAIKMTDMSGIRKIFMNSISKTVCVCLPRKLLPFFAL